MQPVNAANMRRPIAQASLAVKSTAARTANPATVQEARGAPAVKPGRSANQNSPAPSVQRPETTGSPVGRRIDIRV